MKKIHSQKGFTLIELLVVIAIISLLSSVALASTGVIRIKSRDAARKSAAIQMRNALALYDLNNMGYPTCEASDGGQPNTCAADGNLPGTLANPLKKFIATLPKDPLNTATYKFFYSTSPHVKTGFVDSNGNTVNISNQATFYYLTEGKTAQIGSAFFEGIISGQPDYVTYPATGYPAALNSTLGVTNY